MFSAKLVVAVMAMQITTIFGQDASDKRSIIREPQSTPKFRVYAPPVDISQSVSQRDDEAGVDHKIRLALRYLEENHGISTESVRITAAPTNSDTGVSHVYARQKAGGVDVLDGVANVNIDKHGRVISSSQTFAPTHQVRRAVRGGRRLAARSPDESLKKALKTLSSRVKPEIDDEALKKATISTEESDSTQAPKFTIEGLPADAAVNGVATAQQSMMQGSDGTLVPVWDIFLQQPDHSWSARINMVTDDIETLVDRRLRSYRYSRRSSTDKEDGLSTARSLEKRLSYLVVPITKPDPKNGFDLVVNPETASSPNGWVDTNTTSGNNVIAYRGEQENVAEITSPDTFAYSHEDSEAPSTAQNIGAALTNVFYVVNSLHDMFYLYGFTEVMFNFQEDNFGRGGQGNDRVLASVQDADIDNGADFFTPPDGQSGELRVGLWDLKDPTRDGALDNGVVVHAYGLGVANRLTGGGTGTCLQSVTSSGLRDGWGDAFAEWLSQTAEVGDFVVGGYVAADAAGLRKYPYSRDQATNPLTYTDGTPSAGPSTIGEVWANMLHNLLASLSDNWGWSETAVVDASGGRGNVVFMHLVVDGLSIQPCEPTFVTARDAIIQADQNRYNGDNFCIIWRVFASRGLGFSAAEDYVNSFSVPPGC